VKHIERYLLGTQDQGMQVILQYRGMQVIPRDDSNIDWSDADVSVNWHPPMAESTARRLNKYLGA
jgi:hypothetical protein